MTESMLWLSVTAMGASISWSAVTRGLQDSESCLALFSDGGVAAGGGDRLPPRGCRPLLVALKTVSTIHAISSAVVTNYWRGPTVHNIHSSGENRGRRSQTWCKYIARERFDEDCEGVGRSRSRFGVGSSTVARRG